MVPQSVPISAKKQERRNQDRSRNPRQRARQNSTRPDAPFRERGPSTASDVQEPFGSGWRFSGKQILNTRRLFDWPSRPACRLRMSVNLRIMILRLPQPSAASPNNSRRWRPVCHRRLFESAGATECRLADVVCRVSGGYTTLARPDLPRQRCRFVRQSSVRLVERLVRTGAVVRTICGGKATPPAAVLCGSDAAPRRDDN